MRVLAAMAALAFTVAPGTEPHSVTLRFDTVTAGQKATIDITASGAGLHSGASSAPSVRQLSVSTPASVVVDGNVDGVMIDAQNGANIRVSFEHGGSERELALKIAGSRVMLRRNMDGDLVPGSRSMAAPRAP